MSTQEIIAILIPCSMLVYVIYKEWINEKDTVFLNLVDSVFVNDLILRKGSRFTIATARYS